VSIKPPITSENSSKHRHRIKYYLVTAGLVALLLMAFAVWWNLSFMMQLGLQQFLNRTPLLSPKISGFQFGFTQVGLEEMEFGIETGEGLLSAKLKDVKVGYHFNVHEFSIPKVEVISVIHAHLRLASPVPRKPVVKSGNGAAIAFPLDQLTVENLDFEASTAYGLSRFAGSVQIKRGNKEVIEAKFQDEKQAIGIEFGSGFRTAKISIEQLPGGKVFELNAEHLEQPSQQAKVHARVGAFILWLSTSPLLPETMQTAITSATTPWIKPNLSKLAQLQMDFNGSASDNFGTVHGKAFLSQNNRYIANADLSKAKSGAFFVEGRLDMTATDALEWVQPWRPEATREWRLSSGQIQGVTQLRWHPGRSVSGTAHVKIFDVALVAGPVKIDHGTINIDTDDFTKHSVVLSAVAPNLVIGKEMTARNLIVKVRYLDHKLTVERGMLSIYDGFVEVLPATVNVNERPVLLSLRVSNVDLAQLLSSLNYKDLTATGTVSGELPLKFAEDSIELLDGSLNGTRPGVLRYQGPVSDKENLAFRALRNLEYRRLHAKVNYRPNGDYHLGLRMEGSNPEVLSGHPLAFNLNLSGRLPELLQRGFIAGNFERVILEEAKPKPTNTKNKPVPAVGEQQHKPQTADRRNQ